MTNESSVIIRSYLKKADDTIKAVKLLCDNGIYSDAVSRAYYAAFYSVTAVLLSKNLSFSSHNQVIGSFDREFIKNGVFSKDISVILHALFDERQSGDYDALYHIDKIEAYESMLNAEKIIDSCRKYLNILSDYRF